MNNRKFLKKYILLIFSICISFVLFSDVSYAYSSNFPTTEINAEAGILRDAYTGATLFEKNADERYSPASTTKLMTAYIVSKYVNDFDAKIKFSHDAVYNVEKGSSNAGIDEGDELSVRDCLYALLFKSANESANALAEYVAGSREAFVELMNKEARILGCSNTCFENPSGFNGENHYTTARDLSIIAAAFMKDKRLMDIESNSSYKLPPTKNNLEGLTLWMEHKMLLKNSKYYDSRALAGKTGYTIKAGNTLVTIAESDGRTLIAVVLKDKMPYHYIDTKALFDLGFSKYENQKIEHKSLFDMEKIGEEINASGKYSEKLCADNIYFDKELFLTLPLDSSQEGIKYRFNYKIPECEPSNTLAKLSYFAGERLVGSYYVYKNQSINIAEADNLAKDENEISKKTAAFDFNIEMDFKTIAIIGFMIVFIILSAILVFMKISEKKAREERLRRRRERLGEMGISETEFSEMLKKQMDVNPASKNNEISEEKP